MADNRLSIEIAAIDAFSKTFTTLQDELTGLQKDARAAFSATPSVIQKELAALQTDYNKTSQKLTKSADEVVDGSKRIGKGVQDATKDVGKMGEAFSAMQQMAIQAFSLGAIMGFIKESFNASMQMDSINSKLKVLTGTAKGAATEWQFIQNEARRLGLDLQSTADAYTSFAVATKNTSMEGTAARKMFISVAEAATALHLPADQVSRVLYQFQQMLSKGKVNMEDLKTASESFPGLMKQVADSLGITTAALLDQMQKGELMSAEVLPKLADQLHKTYGTAAVEAAKQGRAAINQMNSEIFKLKEQVGSDMAPGLVTIGTALTNIAKAVVGGWMLIAVQVGYTWDYIKTKMDLTLSKDETRTKLGQITQAYREQITEITKKYGEQKAAITTAEQQTTDEVIRNNQRRRNEAKKTGEDLAKINLDYFKAAGMMEQELSATMEKEYQERIKATKAYYDQKKAAATSNDVELQWEEQKNQALEKLYMQRAQDHQIITARMIATAVDLRKEGLAVEIAAIRQQAADEVVTAAEAERSITALNLAALRDQYQAKQYVAQKIGEIYGKDSEDYKKALEQQKTSHTAYINAKTDAYKRYSDKIKEIEKSIADFRLSIQEKIRDISQKGMTDEQKYADNTKRFNEALDRSEEARRRKQTDEALKYSKQAEELAGRLADSQVKGVDGVKAATEALQAVEENRIKILEQQKAETQESMDKLKEVADMKLDPKKLEINLDEATLSRVKEEMANLTKSETKRITIETIGPDTDRYNASIKGMASGGWVGGSGIGDTQLRALDPREFVLKPSATSFWGSSVLSLLNNPFSASAQNLRATLSGLALPSLPASSPSFAMANGGQVGNLPDMGTITLNIGSKGYPVIGKVDVLAELKTALRREQLTRTQ